MNKNTDRHKKPGKLVRFPKELKERLEKVADKHSMTMQTIIVQGTENRVKELEEKDPV